MSGGKRRLTVVELFYLLKKTSIPTILVEGVDDIIFYRSMEHDLKDLGVDMLPAGNKSSVLELRDRLRQAGVKNVFAFIVDRDLWVYEDIFPVDADMDGVVLTSGYSIENDIFCAGGIFDLLSPEEVEKFNAELQVYLRWYCLCVIRRLGDAGSAFRTHPSKILDDPASYADQVSLKRDEDYPEAFYNFVFENYGSLLRGKSLFALLLRFLSASKRDVKFSGKQLMAIGASRRGAAYENMLKNVRGVIEPQMTRKIFEGNLEVV